MLISGVPVVLKFLKFQSCPEIVLKFKIVLKFLSFSTNVLILAVILPVVPAVKKTEQ